MGTDNKNSFEPMLVTPAFLKELNALLELGQSKLGQRIEKLSDLAADSEKEIVQLKAEVSFRMKALEVKLLEIIKKSESDKVDLLKKINYQQELINKVISEQPEKVQKITQNKLAVITFIIMCLSVSVPSIMWLVSQLMSIFGG